MQCGHNALRLGRHWTTDAFRAAPAAMRSVCVSVHRHFSHGVPRAPLVPPPPPPPPSLSSSSQLQQQQQGDTADDGWDDLLFFNFADPHRTASASSIGGVATAASPLFAENEDTLGIGAAMAMSEAAVVAEAGTEHSEERLLGPTVVHKFGNSDGAERDELLSGRGARPAVDPTAEERTAASASFDSEADLAAYFERHHAAHLRGRERGEEGEEDVDLIADAEAMMRESFVKMAEMGSHSAADIGGYRRAGLSGTPRVRSSEQLLGPQGDLAGDLVTAEAERTAQEETQLVVAALKQYAPADEEIDLLASQEDHTNVDGDEDGDGDEEAAQARELREGLWWWHQPRQQQPDATKPSAGVVARGAELMSSLRIPDKEGRVAEVEAAAAAAEKEDAITPNSSSVVSFPPAAARMASRKGSYLSAQDSLYLAPQTPPEAQAADPSCLPEGRRQCVLVAFAANDLRVHDNYALALASVRAHTAGGLPVVAVCVLDYRTFSQPSVVGGFFRQSPLRASFMLSNVAALRDKLEMEFRVPLLIRVGRPEEHIPRLAVELGAVDVFLTTQYAPHERRVHDAVMQAVRRGAWVARQPLRPDELDNADAFDEGDVHCDLAEERMNDAQDGDGDAPLVRVCVHDSSKGDYTHPYGEPHTQKRRELLTRSTASFSSSSPQAVPHSVWQTTLVHLDDLPTPVAAMKEGERWYHDDVTTATIRATKPYDRQVEKLKGLPSWTELLPLSPAAVSSASVLSSSNATVRGALPTLFQLGYALDGHDKDLSRLLSVEEVIATQSSHPAGGEDAAIAHVRDWLEGGGMTSMLRYGRPRRTNTKMYSQKLARVSPYLSAGTLSPRKFYELLRSFAHDNLRDGFVQMQFREALLRLSRRDYWHWMGLRFGDRLFYSYGPHPETTDRLPDWRRDPKIVQKWCLGLTGIPFADAAMRELLTTGFVANEGRQGLIWLLVRGYGQDWRLGAEWLERCSLDYDPFVCYGNAAYCGELIRDDFGETVRSILYLAHHHDQTGIYVKKWLPQLSKVPPVYIHRPQVLTPRMQAMHGVYLGKNYPYPLKLWDGAQHTLGIAKLPAYFAGDGLTNAKTTTTTTTAEAEVFASDAADKNHKTSASVGPGYAEAVRCGVALMEPEELSTAVNATFVVQRQWARAFLPETIVAAIEAGDLWEDDEAVPVPAVAGRQHRQETQKRAAL